MVFEDPGRLSKAFGHLSRTLGATVPREGWGANNHLSSRSIKFSCAAVHVMLRNATGGDGAKQFDTPGGKLLFAIGVSFSVCMACLFLSFVHYTRDDRRRPQSPEKEPACVGVSSGALDQDKLSAARSKAEKGESETPPLSPSWKMIYSENPVSTMIHTNTSPVAWVPQPSQPSVSARIVREPEVAKVLTLL